jgi:alpha-L-rhamnosidase
MENYVLRALCEMGYVKEAYKRMVSRYYNLAMNENTTLWEDFYILGTKNHAWSGAPITIAYKYFMGIDTNDGFKTFTINPDKALFKRMRLQIKLKEWICHNRCKQ